MKLQLQNYGRLVDRIRAEIKDLDTIFLKEFPDADLFLGMEDSQEVYSLITHAKKVDKKIAELIAVMKEMS